LISEFVLAPDESQIGISDSGFEDFKIKREHMFVLRKHLEYEKE